MRLVRALSLVSALRNLTACAVPVSASDFLVVLNKSSLCFPILPEFQLEETPVLSSSLKLQISRREQRTQRYFSVYL